jgi:hypothetical protein
MWVVCLKSMTTIGVAVGADYSPLGKVGPSAQGLRSSISSVSEATECSRRAVTIERSNDAPLNRINRRSCDCPRSPFDALNRLMRSHRRRLSAWHGSCSDQRHAASSAAFVR